MDDNNNNNNNNNCDLSLTGFTGKLVIVRISKPKKCMVLQSEDVIKKIVYYSST